MDPPVRPLLRVPAGLNIAKAAHEKWLQILDIAEMTVYDEANFQQRCIDGERVLGRSFPPQVLGRYYARYCDLINKMYDAYLNSIHMQRSPYILEIITLLVKRMYELRNELVKLMVTDYIYVDTACEQLRLTPFDIQIVLPYHFPLESRTEDKEQLLQKMWAAAVRKKKLLELQAATSGTGQGIAAESTLAAGSTMAAGSTIAATSTMSRHSERFGPHEDEDIISESSEETVVDERLLSIITMQRHERYRQWFAADFRAQCIRRKTYFASEGKEAPAELKYKAAKEIQRVYREYMKLKRKFIVDKRRDVLIGLIPDPLKKRMDFDAENIKIYEKRKAIRMKIQETLEKETVKENERLIMFKKDNQISDISDQVQEWFKEWYYGYGFFPEYPYDVEGGTVMVIRNEFITIEEKQEEDALMAGQTLTKDQIKAEKQREKAEAKLKAEQNRIAMKKAALAAYKAKLNPFTDPGYMADISPVVPELVTALRKYRSAWSMIDTIPSKECGEAIYGYLKPLITEELMSNLHIECRKYVDEIMRMELKVLIESHKKLYKSIGKKFPVIKPRKKPKVKPIPKPLVVDHKLLKNIQIVFDLNLISKPTAKLNDIYGDMNFAAYDYNVRDPNAAFPPPGVADIKRRLMLSCILGCGIQPGAKKKNGVMLIGPVGTGKSFYVDVVAGELNAVKIDITPEVFSAVLEKPAKSIAQVFQAAKTFQPAVIFMRNIERVYAKKVLPEDKYLKAATLKPVLAKIVKQISERDKVIFIATCSNPFDSTPGPMVGVFSEIILVPRTDYGSLSKFFAEKLQREPSAPRDFRVNCLAQVCKGYGFGTIIRAYNEVVCAERKVNMNVKPLLPKELLEKLLDFGEVYTDDEYKRYMDFYLQNSPIKIERIEFHIINMYREEAYKKQAKLDAEEAKKKK